MFSSRVLIGNAALVVLVAAMATSVAFFILCLRADARALPGDGAGGDAVLRRGFLAYGSPGAAELFSKVAGQRDYRSICKIDRTPLAARKQSEAPHTIFNVNVTPRRRVNQ